ncbi:hypothetical protein [Streptomyces sp. NBC_01465]|uniref:hypothetical protein n=1 Tax=Streptomyces sp. NBC_01465 TaxID=2903878 RepID=UPI002E33D03A|nr:hypothetical protein [Streptomyces sp. NBC_01465]
MTTPDQLELQHTLLTATARYDALRVREMLGDAADLPLTREETLELLALSEVIVRKAAYGRHLSVRSARESGASWAQIGASLGTSRQAAQEAHDRWLDERRDSGGI